eukprot:TRINITY_DN9675_c0_g5_i1.p1 TRINITY_DN9675_c0_g5~~TRINITY_DN9675_c0_g5_i1.p1  ORF type:complete len:398 (-),score=65.95 TRINITY_DN9675_c0_g5_i1:1189-2382(-)
MSTLLMAILVPVSLILALLFTIILIKVFCPAFFFKIQTPPGFILHAITGGNVPPYFSYDCFRDEHFKEWCRDGDVVVCVAAKSGTTWLLNCVHQIRTLGDPKGFLKHNTHTMPWPECRRYPGETVEESLAYVKTLDGMTNPEYPFRVFKSHYKPRIDGVSWSAACKTDAVMPVRQRPGVKYIVCIREGKDVLASFYPFFAAHKPEFKKLWGGFPPTFKDFSENFKFFTEDQPGFYHGYAAQWWAYRNDPNVLFLHFSDLKKDIKKELRKIAAFVGVKVPESAWPLIEEKTSFKWMQDNEEIFKYYIESEHYTGTIMNSEKGSMIRKGTVGDGKDKLTPEQEKKWQELNDQYFGDKPGLAEWALTGGPVPPPTASELQAQTISNTSSGMTDPLLSNKV